VVFRVIDWHTLSNMATESPKVGPENGPVVKIESASPSAAENLTRATHADPSDSEASSQASFPNRRGLSDAIRSTLRKPVDAAREYAGNVVTERLTIPKLAWQEKNAITKAKDLDTRIGNVEKEIEKVRSAVSERSAGFDVLRNQLGEFAERQGSNQDEGAARAKDETQIDSLASRLAFLKAQRAAAEHESNLYAEQKREHARRLLVSCEIRLQPFDEKIAGYREGITQLDATIGEHRGRIAHLEEKASTAQELLRTNKSPEVQKQAQGILNAIRAEMKTAHGSIAKAHERRQKHFANVESVTNRTSRLREKKNKWHNMVEGRVVGNIPSPEEHVPVPPTESDAPESYARRVVSGTPPPSAEPNETMGSSSETEPNPIVEFFRVLAEDVKDRKMQVREYVAIWNGLENSIVSKKLQMDDVAGVLRESNDLQNNSDKVPVEVIEKAVRVRLEQTGKIPGSLDNLFMLIRLRLLFKV
jgi:uncharacterized coiled-coil protein SlyX